MWDWLQGYWTAIKHISSVIDWSPWAHPQTLTAMATTFIALTTLLVLIVSNSRSKRIGFLQSRSSVLDTTLKLRKDYFDTRDRILFDYANRVPDTLKAVGSDAFDEIDVAFSTANERLEIGRAHV